jgi:hypothetical protein
LNFQVSQTKPGFVKDTSLWLIRVERPAAKEIHFDSAGRFPLVDGRIGRLHLETDDALACSENQIMDMAVGFRGSIWKRRARG